jgi:peptidoglycan lytic transglycosylase B
MISKSFSLARFFTVFALFALLIKPVLADTSIPPADFSFLKSKLIQDGISESTVEEYFGDERFHIIPELLKINIKQPSGTAGYQRFVGDESVQRATEFLKKHRTEIENVLEGTNIDSEIVVAIINVESSLGKYKGTYKLMNVFASLTLLESEQLLTWSPEFWTTVLEDVPEEKIASTKNKVNRRARSKAKWGYKQLKALFEMAEEATMDPLEAKGSWAGAYGLPQFIPTSALAYGKDGNDDGKIDLHSLPDAVASVANYLKVHRYKKDIPEKRRKAVWHYNHSDEYVDCIITLAEKISVELDSTK